MGAPSAGRIIAKKKTNRITGVLIIDPSHLLLSSNRNQTNKSTKFVKEGFDFPADLK
jgi:hypothetical protein